MSTSWLLSVEVYRKRKISLYLCLWKKLKKGPEEYSDVREEVEIDYRREQERGLLTSLMQHFGVEIEQDVLKQLIVAEVIN